MKKLICFIMIFAAIAAVFGLASCGKKDSETTESSIDIVAEIPYVSDFTCDYFTGKGFNDRVARNTAFGSEEEVLIKINFMLSAEAFAAGKKKLTVKPVLPDGVTRTIFSANTSSVNNADLTAAYDADDKKSKNCEIELKAQFNYSGGELQIGYAYDDDVFRTTGYYLLMCGQSYSFAYDVETNGYCVNKDPNNYEWLYYAKQAKIPNSYKGKPVTALGKELFRGCNVLTGVEIPQTVTAIGDYAFSGCGGLQNFTLPDGVTNIGDYAFDGCDGLKYNEYGNALYLGSGNNPYCVLVKAANAGITSVDVNRSTKIIYSGAFYSCGGLASVTIPDGVTVICDNAFGYCKNLTSVTMPDSVTRIGSYAFAGCDALNYNEYNDAYYLGNEQNPFAAFIGLKSNDATRADIHADTKVIITSAFKGCSSLASVTLPVGITRIPEYAFEECRGLTGVIIPDGVTFIGDYAFSGCGSLASVEFGSGVKIIGVGAFIGCGSLTSVTISENISNIGEKAFYQCVDLSAITIPKSVTYLGFGAFSSCDSLAEIAYGGTIKEWASVNSRSWVASADGRVTVRCSDGEIKCDLYY